MTTLSPDAHVILDRLCYNPPKKTVAILAAGWEGENGALHGGTGWPASRVRAAIGELYGAGYIKVVAIENGQPLWERTTDKERLAL